MLDQLIRLHGIPAAVYQDRHSALRRNDEHWSLQEQLAGRQLPTQVGQALADLSIRAIFATSPQAKGRIERLFGILQDRLLTEMSLDSIGTLEQANSYLKSWIPRFNRRFAKAPATRRSAFRSVHRLNLEKILSFRYPATILNDNTVRLGGLVLDIPPGPRRRSYAKARVDVRQHLDGSWSVYYQDRRIAQHPPSPITEPLHCRKRNRYRTQGYDDLLLYLPATRDIFPRQLGGQIASA